MTFLFNNITKDYSQKWNLKKKKAKNQTKKQEITKKYRNLSEDEKTKKTNYANIKNKNMLNAYRKWKIENLLL